MLPPSALEYLREAMPQVNQSNGNTSGDPVIAYDYEAWLDHVFEE